jgi:hypothetical protein
MNGPEGHWPRWDHFVWCSGSIWGKSQIGELRWAIGGTTCWIECLTTLWTRRHTQFIGSGGGGLWIWDGAVEAGEGRGHWHKSYVSFTVAGLPTTSQQYGAVLLWRVKLQGMWHLIGRQPSPVSLSELAVSQADTAAGRNRVSSSSAVPDFFTEEHYPCSNGRESWRRRESGRKVTDGEGGEPAILFSQCTIRTPFSLSDRAICRALISVFVWQLVNLSVTKL